MQKVRSTFIAMLSLAALAACGDKVEIVQPVTPTPAIREIQLTNTAPSIVVCQETSIGATVIADAGFAGNRGVTWSISGSAVTQVSATANSITVRGAAPGSALITATSADANNASVTARSTVTVTAAPTTPTTPTTPASVVISRIRQGDQPAAGGGCVG